ncbi:MAG: hypothetical protein HYV39_02500 [Candidatus Levybacteria bacterium]|nr:hypothetical protein [Candidatus Levybacteria bacterium]
MKLKLHTIFLLLLLFSLPAIAALFHPGFFQSDDGEWMIIRFSAFHQALADGQFPVRFLHRLNYGYGYPVADFLYPGFMYLGEILKLLGFGFVDTIKITLGISLLESAIFSYFWLRSFFGKWSSLLGALFYLYTPYHLFDIYARGSVGETLSLALPPFVLWQIERKSLFWTSLGVALLILSHNTLAVLFLPIIAVYGFLRHTPYAIFFGLGLSAFFWIPALYDLQYTVFNQTKISKFGEYFSDINLIGLSTIFVILSACAIVYRKRSTLSSYFLFICISSIFLATSLSHIFWEILPVSFVQFPFRFLSIAILSTSFLSAYILDQFKEKNRIIIFITLLSLLGFSAIPYVKPKVTLDKGDLYYATNEATTTVQDEYMPVWVKQKPTEHFKNKVEILEGKGKIENLVFNNKKIHFDVNMKNSGIVRVNTVYFPGWKAYVGGAEIEIDYSNKYGVMDISVVEDKSTVKFIFSETPVRLFGDILSISSFGMLLGFVFLRRRRL